MSQSEEAEEEEEESKDLSPSASESLSNVQNNLASYGIQIQNYLRNLKADISDYKFAIEKTSDGLVIDVRFKGRIRPAVHEEEQNSTTP